MSLYNLSLWIVQIKSATDSSNLRPLGEAVVLFPGTDFQDYALLSSREVQDACQCMYNYIIKVDDSIEQRFPEMEFMVSITAFSNPLM